ncbi:MAG: hypothetical protein IJ797_08570, partial [Selenomonadaceae bacterium]|nr:hypothetical protein [Selenomonadaceae bacterium]
MNKFAKAVTGILTGTILTVTAGAGFIYTQRDALIQKVAAKAADIASDALGTRVEIGDIIIGNLGTESMSDITVKDLALYDKNSELIARAESAEVNFKLLDLYNDPLTAINEINVKNVEGNIVKRDNDTWNFNDIKTSSGGESNFDADINIENAKINAKFDDNELIADVENAAIDFDSTAKFIAELNVNSVEGDITALINSDDDSADDSNSAVEVYDSDFGSYSNELTKVLAATASSTAEDTFSLENLNLKLDFDHTNIKVEADVQNVNADINDNEIEASNLKAKVDYDNADDKQNIEAEVSARAFDSTNINATASVTDNKQVVNADVNFLDVKNVLPFIPDDIMPAGVELVGGIVNDASIKVIKRGEDLTFDGSAKIYNGGVKVEQIDIENINGTVSFNNSEVLVDAAMSANGQQAEVEGSIHIDTDEPYFDINAKSDSFNPNAIMYLPTEGVASFNAHLTGTVSNPIVDADIYSPSVVYEDLSLFNISTHMKYAEDVVYLSDFKTNIFGGTARGDIEFKAQDLSYNAHIKADSISVNRLKNYLPALADVSGSISADVGINGVSDDLDQLKIYGSATTYNVYYDNITINRADASFYVEGDDVKIDYLSASLPNRGSIGAEGTITDGDNLDLKFYGGHVDMSVIENFIPQVDVSGLADFQGQINGHVDNPDINLQLSAVDNSKREGDNFKGVLFDQPYDSIVLTASGSLDGVEISKFNMIRDGKDVWIAKGKVGLTGEKNLDIRVDTVGARAETIVALVAPDQELTGNVDNVITVTGTLDNPHLTGYVHFWRGSYRGILVNSMDGDYFIEGNKIRLQDFHINSPMIDMDLNGVIDRVTTDMDFTVEAYDVNMRRFEGKLPENYPARGHGSFSGIIKGNMDHPIFDGKLAAKELSFNGVSITNVDGEINVNGNDIHLDNFSFNQGDGSYKVRGNINYVTGVMNGNSEVTNVDIPELFALANLKNELVTGKLNSKMEFGGTIQNPSLYMIGNISKGTFAGSDIHDINLEFNLKNNTVYIDKLEGFQGETGALSAEGKASLIGPLDMTLSAHNLELAMFAKAVGLDAEVVGTTNIEAKIGGTSLNPDVEMEIVANGGIKGSTFDLMRGNLELKDGIVNVNNFIVQRAIAEKMYQVSAKGIVPLVSLTTDKASKLNSQEQINLDISLDGADLSLLPVISDYVAWALGEMQGNLKITGTASDPRINGTISVAEGSTKIKNMSSLIEHMNM